MTEEPEVLERAHEHAGEQPRCCDLLHEPIAPLEKAVGGAACLFVGCVPSLEREVDGGRARGALGKA